jgi:small conductance mechanosensitive channel
MPIISVDIQGLLAAEWVQFLRAALVIIGAFVARRLTLNWTGSAMRRARIDTGTQILIKRGISGAYIVLTTLIVLGILGANPTGLLAVAGAVGLAFSLAIQDILKNFFSGLYLLLERPFHVGDTIKVKDQQGTVENIGVRTTVLRTPENIQVLVPNAVLFVEVVTNHSNERTEAAVADGQSSVEPTTRV